MAELVGEFGTAFCDSLEGDCHSMAPDDHLVSKITCNMILRLVTVGSGGTMVDGLNLGGDRAFRLSGW